MNRAGHGQARPGASDPLGALAQDLRPACFRPPRERTVDLQRILARFPDPGKPPRRCGRNAGDGPCVGVGVGVLASVAVAALGCGTSHDDQQVDSGPQIVIDDGGGPWVDGGSTTPAACGTVIDLVGEGLVSSAGAFRFVGELEEGGGRMGGSCGGGSGNEVIVRYLPPASGRLLLELDDARTDFDTILYARDRCDAPESELGCDDDGGEGLSSRLRLDVEAGRAVDVVIDGYGEHSQGLFILEGSLRATDGDSLGETCAAPRPVALDGSGSASVSGDTSTSTDDEDGSCGRSSADDTWSFTIAEPRAVQVRLVPEDGFDAVLRVQDGCRGEAIELACEDHFAEETATLASLEAGTYVVIVDGYDEDEFGSYELSITTREPPASCAMPHDLLSVGHREADGTLRVSGDTSFGGRELDAGCAGSAGPELVYAFTPAMDGTLVLSTDDDATDLDTVLYVREDCAAAATEIACDDDSGAGLTSTVITEVRGGEPLQIVVDGSLSSSAGEFALSAELIATSAPPRPGADLCTEATPLRPSGSRTQIAVGEGNTDHASDDVRGTCGHPEEGVDHVFSFTLGERRDVDIDLELGRGFDAVLYVLDGCGGLADEIDCTDSFGDEHLSISAMAAGTYYVVVDGYDDADKGEYRLRVMTRPPRH